jgi:hypothetical protein
MIVHSIISQIDKEIKILQQARVVLIGKPAKVLAFAPKHKGRRVLSADARKRISDAQKARWAKTKKKTKKAA